MKKDIVDKINQYAPDEIRQAANNIARRRSLDDDKINGILRDIFNSIDPDCLNPELAYRYHEIKGRL